MCRWGINGGSLVLGHVFRFSHFAQVLDAAPFPHDENERNPRCESMRASLLGMFLSLPAGRAGRGRSGRRPGIIVAEQLTWESSLPPRILLNVTCRLPV
jgi:hypothetical protein